MHEGDPLIVFKAFIQAVYDDDRRIYHTTLRESAERFDNELL